MTDFLAVTASSGPRLKDPAAVQTILASYVTDPALHLEIEADPTSREFRLALHGFFWPEAWKVPPGTRPEDFNPYDDGFFDQGAAGFRQLLQEIAPCLAEPLTVQAIGHLQGRFPLAACEWHVGPDNPQVHIHEFPHGGDESVVEVLPPERFGNGPPVPPEGRRPSG